MVVEQRGENKVKIFFTELVFLLGDDKKKIPPLLILFGLSSVIDLIGIGLIGPYMSLIMGLNTGVEILHEIVSMLGLSENSSSTIQIISVILFFVFFCKAASLIWINYKIIQFSNNQMVRLRSVLMQAYQLMPYELYIQRNSSEYIYSIYNLVGQYSGLVLIVLRIISDSLVALVILMFLVLNHALELAILLSLLFVFIFSYDRLFRSKIYMYGKLSNIAATSMVQGIHEGLEGLKEIRILGNAKYFWNKVYSQALEKSKLNTKSQIISSIPRYLLEFMIVSFIVMLVIIATLFNQNIESSLPMFAVFGVAALRLLPAVNVISSGVVELRHGKDSVSRLYLDLCEVDKKKNILVQEESDSVFQRKNTFHSIALKNVSYFYPNTKESSLRNISLKINNGDSIGIIGTSGSGKTTLIDVLLGLVPPSKGIVMYNDDKLEGVAKVWSDQVAYIPQDVFLIDDTLRSNIALGVEENIIDESMINQALIQASLHQFVEKLPLGVATVIGERGIRLSGGQKQRIALARAFYHKRDVFVMDESTSALDNETENEVMEEIRQMKGKKTMIVIAHRLTTLKDCDRIIKIEDGRIVKEGSYSLMIDKAQVHNE